MRVGGALLPKRPVRAECRPSPPRDDVGAIDDVGTIAPRVDRPEVRHLVGGPPRDDVGAIDDVGATALWVARLRADRPPVAGPQVRGAVKY